MRSWLLGKEYFKAVEALEFASKYHTGIRKDGVTPEFHHQISIAHYLRTLPRLRDQEKVLIVAFLHDVVEDFGVSPEVISAKFGEGVSIAVMLLSKKIKEEKKSIPNYYSAMRANHIASIVKGGDRIHNFQTCSGVFTLEKQEKYITETEEYILPMLKESRNNFPDQELAYENIKHALKGQIELIKIAIDAQRLLNIERSDCKCERQC
jgi:(p)ppGpp synthase/HD superfamily hydrolase